MNPSSEHEPPETVEFAGLIIAPDYLATANDRRLIARVAAAEVERLVLRYGQLAKSVVAQVAFACVLLLCCAFWAVMGLRWMRERGEVSFVLVFGTAFTGVLGGWLLRDAFRRGDYIEITVRGRHRKLAFNRPLTVDDKDWLIQELKDRFGWIVEKN